MTTHRKVLDPPTENQIRFTEEYDEESDSYSLHPVNNESLPEVLERVSKILSSGDSRIVVRVNNMYRTTKSLIMNWLTECNCTPEGAKTIVHGAWCGKATTRVIVHGTRADFLDISRLANECGMSSHCNFHDTALGTRGGWPFQRNDRIVVLGFKQEKINDVISCLITPARSIVLFLKSN